MTPPTPPPPALSVPPVRSPSPTSPSVCGLVIPAAGFQPAASFRCCRGHAVAVVTLCPHVSFSPPLLFPGVGAKKSAPSEKTAAGPQDHDQQAAGGVGRAGPHLGHPYVTEGRVGSSRTPSSSNGRLSSVTGWLDDIGLPQYKDQFNEGRVDGRMLQFLTVVSDPAGARRQHGG